MVKGKAFFNQATPSVIDTEYEDCNFAHAIPVNDGGVMKGNRLFPGDDTPRTFRNCHMPNCEPPPGSVLVNSKITIIEKNVYKDSDTIEVDGQTIEIKNFKTLVHGRYSESGYEHYSTPKELPCRYTEVV